MLNRIIPIALVGLVLWKWKSHHDQKYHKQVSAKPEEVTTWEGEGGALPESGPQIGPEPTHTAPQASVVH